MPTLMLPIRLVPRRNQQFGLLLFFAVFFIFAIVWMAGATGILDPDSGKIRLPPPGSWLELAFALFGLPFALIGIGGMATAGLKLRRHSPHFHIALDDQGIIVKDLFTLRRFTWSGLPPFETIRVERRTRSGYRIAHYTVAMEVLPDTGRREMLRIRAYDYGAKNTEKDAQALTTWLNALRDLANDRRLRAGSEVQVPAPFGDTAIAIDQPAAAAPIAAARPPNRGPAHLPTVDRQ